MRETGSLEQIFQSDHGKRTEHLQTARTCAKLTKPHVLPDDGQSTMRSAGHSGDSPLLNENYQTIGGRGINNLAGALTTTLFPALPWFKMDMHAELVHDPDLAPELKTFVWDRLFRRHRIIHQMLESAGGRREMRGRQTGFYSAKLRSITHLLITGDTLERMDDDFQLRTYRLDHYITRRDGNGNVLYHITVEEIDPLGLSPDSDELLMKQLNAAHLDRDELERKPVTERMMKLYTRTEFHPRSRVWVIEQGLNSHKIPVSLDKDESEEEISQYFSTALDLTTGEDYGRGFVETCKGNLKSLDILEERTTEWAGMAAKYVPVLDDTESMTRPEDLAKPSGVPIRGKVENGRATKIAFLSVEKMADWRVVTERMAKLEGDLAKTMLIGTESVRHSDRTTAQEIDMLRQQVQGALGGFFLPIADSQQYPTVNYANHLVLKNKHDSPIMVQVPWRARPINIDRHNAYQIDILTGTAAFARSAKVQDLIALIQVAQLLGEGAVRKLKPGAMLEAVARYRNIYEPDIIKSDEELEQEMAAERQAQIQMAAEQQAIQSAGAISEAAAEAAQSV